MKPVQKSLAPLDFFLNCVILKIPDQQSNGVNKMKTKRALLYLLIIVLILTFSSCGMIKIVPIDPTPSTTDAPTEATLNVAPVPDRYTVNFEENEVFPSENARKASLRKIRLFSRL